MMVKVCGVTNREDAEAAASAGATAIGFNFYRFSPRCILAERAAEIGVGLDITKVGVFVNETPARIAEVAALASLDVVQLHGDESPAGYPVGLEVWKAARVGENFDPSLWRDCPADALLLDGDASLLYDGAGRTFDWRIAAGFTKKIILAGGLDAANVRQAIEQARPWGVDACSRIESAPGRKDHRKMAQFIRVARAAFQC